MRKCVPVIGTVYLYSLEPLPLDTLFGHHITTGLTQRSLFSYHFAHATLSMYSNVCHALFHSSDIFTQLSPEFSLFLAAPFPTICAVLTNGRISWSSRGSQFIVVQSFTQLGHWNESRHDRIGYCIGGTTRMLKTRLDRLRQTWKSLLRSPLPKWTAKLVEMFRLIPKLFNIATIIDVYLYW